VTTRRRHQHVRLLAAGASVALAACASGQSILQAGNVATTAPKPTSTTAPAGTVAPPTTICLVEPCATAAPGGPGTTAGGLPTTIQLVTPPAPDTAATTPTETSTGQGPTGLAAAPGVTMPLAGNPDYAPCPVDALDAADGPVRITFWHTMQSAQGEALTQLTNEYNASQDRVVVELQNQNGYEELVDKYFQSSTADRPDLVQMPDYMVQQMADTNTVVTATACIQQSGYDISPFLPRAMFAYQTGGVQWGMPFNISTPVLYYNEAMFEEAGLDPAQPPITLDELRQYSEQIVESGAATYGLAVDSGVNSGGAWFLEQWFARAGLPYADNDNGRTARATQVLFDTPDAVDLLTFAQDLEADGLAFYVGEDPRGIDGLLKLADPEQPAAMTIASSGALGGILSFVEGGAIPGITSDDIGVGPMPGPSDTPSATIGGAALYIVRDRGDAPAAAAWDYIEYVITAEAQSFWADASGYAPVRADATEVEPLATTYAEDPRFRVGYDQVNFAADDFSAVGPALGPMRQVRQATAQMMGAIYTGADVQTALTNAATQSNLLIIDYNSRN
jgi:sn-glycerol 3-phosphate transport system substrate-binding protein